MFSGSDLYLNAPYIFFMIYASFIGTPKSKSNLSSQNTKTKKKNIITKHSSGCTATPNLSQNMFFTGTIPLTADVLQSHQSMAMAQNRTPPTLFQYPSK